jgi:hypothetical protein
LECNEAVHELFIEFKEACDSIRRKVLCNIVIQFGIRMSLVGIIEMCLNEIRKYIRVREGKHLSETFPVKNGLKQGDALSPLLLNFALEYAIRRVQVN